MSKDASKKEDRREKRTVNNDKELYWVFYGIAVAFLFQAIYDGLGLYVEPPLKAIIGIAIGAFMATVLTALIVKKNHT